MQQSETTPLLSSRRSSSSTCAGSHSSHTGSTAVSDDGQRTWQEQDTAQHKQQGLASKSSQLPASYVDKPEDAPAPGCSLPLLLILLFSLFISNIEGSLLLTIHAQIASYFDRYNQSQWLIIAYPLAVSASEPVMGCISNDIGRKRLLLITYVIFAVGAFVCGVAPHFAVFIVGRVLAGIGGSGMFGMVNLIVGDLVGLQSLATYRGYLQAAMASGRLLGGTVGGFVAEKLGWRLMFIAQTPLLLAAAGLCAFLIPSLPATSSHEDNSGDAKSSIWVRLRQVDIGGAFLLVCTITLGLLCIHFLGDGYTIHDLRVCLSLGLCSATGVLFVLVENFLAQRAMFSRKVFANHVVVGVYLVNFLAMTSQAAISFDLPLHEEILNSASAYAAGLLLLPLVICSIAGSVGAGMMIKRGAGLTVLSSIGTVMACSCTAILYFVWSSLSPALRVLDLTGIGLGTAIASASTFISLNAEVSREDQAMAVSTLFCLYGIGVALGTTGSKVAMNLTLRSTLQRQLEGSRREVSKTISSLMEDYQYIHELPKAVQSVVMRCLEESFNSSRMLALATVAAALPFLLLLRSRASKSPAANPA